MNSGDHRRAASRSTLIHRASSRPPPDPDHIARAGRLAGLAPEELASRFGTPLYVYDLDVIDRQVESLRAVLPAVVDLAYAVKANPALAVVAHLGRLGLGADVASAGELATAMPRRHRSGAHRDDRSGQARRGALASRSRPESARSPSSRPASWRGWSAIAARSGRRVPVLLRAAVTEDARLERVRLVGDDGAGKFGMDARDLVAAARHAAGSPHLELLGLHAFGASNVLDASALVEHVAATTRAAVRLARLAGTTVRLVDAGGGLGIPYETHEESLDLVRLGSGIAAIVADWPADPLLPDARLLLEPGRFLVGPAGAYLARVVDRKTVEGSTVVILDGGVHHVCGRSWSGRSTGSARSRAGRPAVSARSRSPARSAPGSTSSASTRSSPPRGRRPDGRARRGRLRVHESMPLFLSHAIPAEVVARDGRAALIRPRQEPGEWLHRQLLVEP